MGVLAVIAALVAVVLALVLALVAFIGSMTNVAPGAIAASLRTRKPGKLSLPKSGLSLEASTVAVGRDNILDLAKARAWMGFCEFAAPDTSPISCIYTFPMLAANLFREVSPTLSSTIFPTLAPSPSPTFYPTLSPTIFPTPVPTPSPTSNPTPAPWPAPPPTPSC